jgi:hypothetical protein
MKISFGKYLANHIPVFLNLKSVFTVIVSIILGMYGLSSVEGDVQFLGKIFIGFAVFFCLAELGALFLCYSSTITKGTLVPNNASIVDLSRFDDEVCEDFANRNNINIKQIEKAKELAEYVFLINTEVGIWMFADNMIRNIIPFYKDPQETAKEWMHKLEYSAIYLSKAKNRLILYDDISGKFYECELIVKFTQENLNESQKLAAQQDTENLIKNYILSKWVKSMATTKQQSQNLF